MGALCPGYNARGVNLITHLNLVPSLNIIGSMFPLPIRLYAVNRVEFAYLIFVFPCIIIYGFY